MKPSQRFTQQPKEFWAHVRSISQHVGYTEPGSGYLPVPPGLSIPRNFQKHGGPRKSTVRAIGLAEIRNALDELGLSERHVFSSGKPTKFGRSLGDYFKHRAKVLNSDVQVNLMDAAAAQRLFNQNKAKYKPTRPPVMNKQKGTKRVEAFLTCMANMVVEAVTKGYDCNYDPLELTTITRDGQPYRTLARRVDGAFPSTVNPIAIWEIKEYYYTTTFGSRIADGVYETLLDGMEIEEFREDLGVDVKHYLLVDSHFTWWGCGKSYLCRIIDMLHMGYVDEVFFGRDVITAFPRAIRECVNEAKVRSRRSQ